jgi:3-oxoacyl-[acyl-carrier protein] reductase
LLTLIRRIGAACARDLAKHGVHLALTYSKNRAGIETLVSEIYGSSAEAAHLRISIHKVDVGIVDEISNLFKEIQEQHRTHIDILVSNAGYGKRIVDVWFVVST